MNMEDRDEMAEGYNSIYLNEFSFECGLLSGGAVLSTVDRVMADCRSGIAIVRPPGHHAEQDEAHGFCVFNNVAVAAQYAISVHGLSRVLILDWDVHHGNGIQHMFYNTNQVLYISLHRYDNGFFFPCSEDADADKVGEGAGKGFNVNIPWNSRKCGDLEYYLAFMNIVMPIAYEYCPELILVSAGFDAARGDPLGGFRVTPGMYGLMTHHLTSLAEGRVVVALEGGYNLTSISESMYMCARALRGDPLPQVNLDSPLRDEVVDTIQQVLDIQQIYWKSLHNTTLPIPENVNLLSEIALPSSSSVDVDDLCTELENSISIPLSTTRHKLLENSVQYS
jgi:histone deacetylase 6